MRRGMQRHHPTDSSQGRLCRRAPLEINLSRSRGETECRQKGCTSGLKGGRMTKEEFRVRWEQGDVTFEEVADCAEEWGLTKKPRTMPLHVVLCLVLNAADIRGTRRKSD